MDELDARLRGRGGTAIAGVCNGGHQVQKVTIVGSRSENQLVS